MSAFIQLSPPTDPAIVNLEVSPDVVFVLSDADDPNDTPIGVFASLSTDRKWWGSTFASGSDYWVFGSGSSNLAWPAAMKLTSSAPGNSDPCALSQPTVTQYAQQTFDDDVTGQTDPSLATYALNAGGGIAALIQTAADGTRSWFKTGQAGTPSSWKGPAIVSETPVWSIEKYAASTSGTRVVLTATPGS